MAAECLSPGFNLRCADRGSRCGTPRRDASPCLMSHGGTPLRGRGRSSAPQSIERRTGKRRAQTPDQASERRSARHASPVPSLRGDTPQRQLLQSEERGSGALWFARMEKTATSVPRSEATAASRAATPDWFYRGNASEPAESTRRERQGATERAHKDATNEHQFRLHVQNDLRRKAMMADALDSPVGRGRARPERLQHCSHHYGNLWFGNIAETSLPADSVKRGRGTPVGSPMRQGPSTPSRHPVQGGDWGGGAGTPRSVERTGRRRVARPASPAPSRGGSPAPSRPAPIEDEKENVRPTPVKAKAKVTSPLKVTNCGPNRPLDQVTPNTANMPLAAVAPNTANLPIRTPAPAPSALAPSECDAVSVATVRGSCAGRAPWAENVSSSDCGSLADFCSMAESVPSSLRDRRRQASDAKRQMVRERMEGQLREQHHEREREAAESARRDAQAEYVSRQRAIEAERVRCDTRRELSSELLRQARERDEVKVRERQQQQAGGMTLREVVASDEMRRVENRVREQELRREWSRALEDQSARRNEVAASRSREGMAVRSQAEGYRAYMAQERQQRMQEQFELQQTLRQQMHDSHLRHRPHA
eukprot:Hpha_TRINITY_DN2891_c0_g1::TRINITY_DN2891_c0_g1_i1::g.171412::m.171412